jgi:radical SAM superfamily enzyme with C-terminal helix-hairpin-helix motif
LGIETVDPQVIGKNNLKATAEESLSAVRLISGMGSGVGWNGQPTLLPGVNLVLGLPGESKETYSLNFEFLRRILDEGLMLRRINIRRVVPVKGTPLWGRSWSQKAVARHSKTFVDRVRCDVDHPMLQRTYPAGRILRGLVAEVRRGRTVFCRFPGTYPVVLGVVAELALAEVIDGIAVSHGFRSLTCLDYPLDINRCPPSTLMEFPGIGARRSARLVRSRPIESTSDLYQALQPDPPDLASLDLIARAAGLA